MKGSPMLKIVLPVALSALSILSPLYAAEVVQGAEGYEFRETFAWAGTHAATLGAGGTTVWWDESAWDVRGDSAYIAVMPIESNITNRFHIDIHKAQSADPRDGRLDNSHTIVGGDGSAGVGVMHLDYQDILDARLRNPLLISPQRPARVRFYASSFNTSGHWWELAITPANRVIGGEYTGVPGQGDAALLEPWPGTTNRSPGPGHSPAEDSVNLVMFGASDVPCITGWQVRAAITRSIGGTTDQFVNTANSMDDLMESYLDSSNGIIALRQENIDDQQSKIQDESDQLTETYNTNYERYVEEYTNTLVETYTMKMSMAAFM